MRVLTMALCGALLTFAGAGTVEGQGYPMPVQNTQGIEQLQRGIQKQQEGAARAIANTQPSMSGGIFSENGSKPTLDIKRGASASSPADPVWRLGQDGGPMPVPTYRLPSGLVLQASEGINPDPGVECIAYCPL